MSRHNVRYNVTVAGLNQTICAVTRGFGFRPKDTRKHCEIVLIACWQGRKPALLKTVVNPVVDDHH
ncbi:hypothetical protein JZX87_18955 [Agrobacterium sp. Ap1]|uniref:hypothetical protein n=1 Tax=Agrobacterium sp. Ap1 TaxID=2815337 RepID=UPI00160E3B5E|nr:hypothetical protein [Agrobacterium sp. Ap1]MBO0143258.1 hypothetical protein [Agrobacterium sp. Ap1]